MAYRLGRLRRHKWRLGGIVPDFGAGRVAQALTLLHAGGVRSLLDVGCSYGAFVAAAMRAGFDSYGVEPTREVVDMIRADGISRISGGFFPDATGPLKRYDALSFFHALMHFPALSQALFQACRALLNRGGTLLVFCTDPRHIGDPDLEASLRSPIALNFTGEAFMRRVARDAGFAAYEHVPSRDEPQCCFHLLTA
jgi:SAM-dependent methyltransferase